MTDVNIFGQIRGAVRQYFATAQFGVQPMLVSSHMCVGTKHISTEARRYP